MNLPISLYLGCDCVCTITNDASRARGLQSARSRIIAALQRPLPSRGLRERVQRRRWRRRRTWTHLFWSGYHDPAKRLLNTMASSISQPTPVRPAQLAFLAIYNPSLGPTDETFDHQVVFYYSRTAHEAKAAAKKHARVDAAGGDALKAEENEKLRQIGLAQGMVDFAR